MGHVGHCLHDLGSGDDYRRVDASAIRSEGLAAMIASIPAPVMYALFGAGLALAAYPAWSAVLGPSVDTLLVLCWGS
jgi:hypothetical protein